jgi:hypothetical protein
MDDTRILPPGGLPAVTLALALGLGPSGPVVADDTVHRTELHDVRLEVLVRGAGASLEPRVPARRPDARDGAPGAASHRRRRRARSAAGGGAPDHRRAGPGRAARRRPASGLRGQPPRLHRLRRGRARGHGQPSSRHRCRAGPPRGSSSRGRRGHLPLRAQIEGGPPLRRTPGLRPRGLSVHHPRRSRGAGPGPVPQRPRRLHHPPPRRRPGARGQPLRRPAQRPAGDLHLRQPQRAGRGPASGVGRAVDPRARTARRRRDQRHPRGHQLRMAGDHPRGQTTAPAPGSGVGTEKEGMASPLLHWTPSIAPSGMAFYQGGPLPPGGAVRSSWGPCGRSSLPASRSRARIACCTRSTCCAGCSGASATCAAARTAISTS